MTAKVVYHTTPYPNNGFSNNSKSGTVFILTKQSHGGVALYSRLAVTGYNYSYDNQARPGDLDVVELTRRECEKRFCLNCLTTCSGNVWCHCLHKP